MVKIDGIAPGQKVHWIAYSDGVCSGIVEKIIIQKNEVFYITKNNNLPRYRLFLNKQEAEIELISTQISDKMNRIRRECKELKELKYLKKQLLTASLAGIELDDSNK